jgi:hypothetical protein
MLKLLVHDGRAYVPLTGSLSVLYLFGKLEMVVDSVTLRLEEVDFFVYEESGDDR